MSFERAKQCLDAYGLGDRVRVFDVSSATVELAAAALGCEGARIAKTLAFLVNDKAVLIVMAGDAKLDNPKYKAQFGTKAKMLSAEQVHTLVGHDVGGVCPFGAEPQCEVYLDASLRRFDTVYPACGSSNSAVELHIPELERACGNPPWIDVGKNWEQAPA